MKNSTLQILFNDCIYIANEFLVVGPSDLLHIMSFSSIGLSRPRAAIVRSVS